MRKSYLLIFLASICLHLFAFESEGDPRSWDKEDFIGFDRVGDCTSHIGDISSVFTRIENNQLFLRITFDDMYSRSSDVDHFADENIQVKLIITAEQIELFHNVMGVNGILKDDGQLFSFLRTPEFNLLELEINWPTQQPKDSLFFNIQIIHDQNIVDEFHSDGSHDYRGGNAAFVHHGNQGLTYSEVFYGQDPLETSGFDEILEVHQATDIPGNFHLSGTLMPAAEWHNPEFNDWLESGVDEGYVSMLTSALGQQMMPFVQNDMNNWSISIESDMVEYRYGYAPKVAWIPERVWLSPGVYPDADVIDWLGDNWEQHGVEAVILDDYIHCAGADNKKIHWMNNDEGINLRVIPIDNDFVGMMHYDADGAKNHISSTGQYGITVYGTDWEVAAEMNEHHNTSFLDNYENVLWYCYDNYPAINVWKLDAALYNSDFSGTGIDIQNGTYGFLGGTDGYGGSNNSWYTDWAATASHSDYHDPQWNYGTVWNDAYNNLMSAPNNSLSQLGWYTLMINLHETGWHTDGEIAGWEHRYSSHIKNANVYVEAARWVNGDFTQTTACFFSDIDHDGGEELIIHNDKVFFVFEGIGGKANWIFYKDESGNGYSVVGSDVAYYSETDGDYNESSNNHVAALSDVSPDQQNSIYDIIINESTGDLVSATLSQWGVSKTIELEANNKYLDITYNFSGETGFIKSGWTPDLLDLIWSGKSHLQRIWGDYGSYCGQRNLANGATVALVLGSGGASFNGEFEGTLVKGDEIYGTGIFNIYLFAGYTSEPDSMSQILELDNLADGLEDELGPQLISAIQVAPNIIHLFFSDNLDVESVENTENYYLEGFSNDVDVQSAYLIYGRKVVLILNNEGSGDSVTVMGIFDNSGNMIDPEYNSVNVEELLVVPHLVGSFNDWDPANHDYDFTLNGNGVWELVMDLPSGEYEYKVLESDDWDENDWPGINQGDNLEASTEVTFLANCGFYTGVRNWDEFVTHTNPIITGSFLDTLGMGNNWDPLNTAGSMNDDDGDGMFTWEAILPEGDWEYKVVLNQNWDQDTYGGGGNIVVTSDGESTTTFNYDMRQNGTTASSFPDTSTASITFQHNVDWNIVGLPLQVEDASQTNLFPNSVGGTLYGFDGSYYNAEELINGNGYWLYFNEQGEVEIEGMNIEQITISLTQGWNLISGTTLPVNLETIDDPGDILVAGTIYGFDGSYFNPTFLTPGMGYWAYASSSGNITISGGGVLVKTKSMFAPASDGSNTITIENQTLYFGKVVSEDNLLSYQLPPKPPKGAHDVRFTGDTKLCAEECIVEIQNSKETLFINYTINPGELWNLVYENSETFDLWNEGTIEINGDISRLELRKSEFNIIPNTFALHPAYPNPFNPVTTISFSIPNIGETNSNASLAVYDLSGRVVETLLDGKIQPGIHTVKWDAGDFPSGVYFVKLETGNHFKTNKVLLIK